MKKILIFTSIFIILMTTAGLGYTPLSGSEHFYNEYSLGEPHEYQATNSRIYNTSRCTSIEAVGTTGNAAFLLTFKVYDGSTAVTSSGSLSGNQTYSSWVSYTSSGVAFLTLHTTLSKYSRYNENIHMYWYVI